MPTLAMPFPTTFVFIETDKTEPNTTTIKYDYIYCNIITIYDHVMIFSSESFKDSDRSLLQAGLLLDRLQQNFELYERLCQLERKLQLVLCTQEMQRPREVPALVPMKIPLTQSNLSYQQMQLESKGHMH